MMVKCEDGSEEEIKAGDVYHIKPGHTAVVKEDSASLDVSPIESWNQLMQHIAANMQEAGQEAS
jgi:hypothetical protein